MGAPVALDTLPNGAVIPAQTRSRLERTMYPGPVVDRVAPDVTVFGGGFLNLTMIEGDDGVLVYDTGETLDDGERLLGRIRAITGKPIAGVLYSHSHYVHGTAALVDDDAGVPVVGHPRLNANLAAGGAGSVFAETAPLQGARTLEQFCHFLPERGPDARTRIALDFGRSGQRPVNRPVADRERLVLAGVELECHTAHGSDTDDCLTVFLPDRGVVLNNLLWPFLPNVYTLRGARFRDPREWRDGLARIRGLRPATIVGTHARALTGQAAIRSTLDAVIDALDLVFDQTMRGILRGLGPEELRAFVRLPEPLASHPFLAEVYGEASHYGPYLYHHALGWFDGDAASINPLPPDEQAARLVDAMGGRAAVLARVREAMAAHEWAWAAQLAAYLHRLDPDDPATRAAKADALEQLGRATPAMTSRSWYLTQARALRGEVAVPRLSFPNHRLLAAQPPAASVDAFRVRLDAQRAVDADALLVLRFTDRDGLRHGLRVRGGVARPVLDPGTADRAPDVELATASEPWLRFFTAKLALPAFLDACTVVAGTRADAERILGLFDDYARREG
jgi:alkyl sulfatase BDS1-like metallo-beta-lactamase superfamily hydrolase